jgi:hypothetical protein
MDSLKDIKTKIDQLFKYKDYIQDNFVVLMKDFNYLEK